LHKFTVTFFTYSLNSFFKILLNYLFLKFIIRVCNYKGVVYPFTVKAMIKTLTGENTGRSVVFGSVFVKAFKLLIF
jgi:hypothetical protein